jgi:hypothetical protein
MGRPLRYLPQADTTFEITSRCVHGRYLVNPSAELNQLILGVIGRAQSLFPAVRLHLLVVASNHIHMILTTSCARLLARFMAHVNGNIAREAGRLHAWKEKFWGRRYRAIPILDHVSLLARARYVLSHGCKEGLVRRPADWPGVNCVKALTDGVQLWGLWFDRSREFEARRQGKVFQKNTYATPYRVMLSPLPCWSHLNEKEQHTEALDLVQVIEKETAEVLEREGRGVLGRNAVMNEHPHTRPGLPKKSPAPFCHTLSRAMRLGFRQSYQSFAQLYRLASSRFRKGDRLAKFPPNCFLPSMAFAGAG